MKNMSTLYQHLRAELAPHPPCHNSRGGVASVWDSAQKGAGDTIHIDYDSDYGSERVFISRDVPLSSPTTDPLPSPWHPVTPFTFIVGFRCTWRIDESPLVHRYGYFGADGKEIKGNQG